MKSRFRSLVNTITAAAAFFMSVSSADAQYVLRMPTTSGIVWATGLSSVAGLNTAMLAGASSGSLMAGLTYRDMSGSYGVKIRDMSSWVTGSIPMASVSGSPTDVPDIALLDNNLGAFGPVQDHFAVVAYPTSSGVTVDCKYFFDDGTVISAGSGTSYISSISSAGVRCVHIDPIAEFASTTGTGRPRCTKFVVTWEASGTVYASFVDITVAAPPSILTATSISAGRNPDVAGIQKLVTGIVHNQALITYTNALNNKVFLRTCDIATGLVGPATTLESMTAGNTVYLPRIDANDDYVNNTSASYSVYKVAAEAQVSGAQVIHTYDNLASIYTPSAVISLSASPPYICKVPTVALGGPFSAAYPYEGTDYIISHSLSYGAMQKVIMMEPINMLNPINISLDMSSTRSYFWASSSSLVTSCSETANAVSTAANEKVMNSPYAWSYPNLSGSFDILFKLSPYAYGFKPQGLAPDLSDIKFRVYPNPATEVLYIENSTGSTLAFSYTVYDMVGRTVLAGNLLGSNEVDVSGLSVGSYILKVGEPIGQNTKKIMFQRE